MIDAAGYGQRTRSRRTIDAAKCSDGRKDIKIVDLHQAKTEGMRDQAERMELLRFHSFL